MVGLVSIILMIDGRVDLKVLVIHHAKIGQVIEGVSMIHSEEVWRQTHVK